MQTQRLYYEDSYIKEFLSQAISCEKRDGFYAVILNKTAFFPEGGGQKSDTGYIGDVFVFDVQEENGEIIHKTKAPVNENEEYSCRIDWGTRFSRMQNHSGEHIVSGLVHKKYGFDNVGFHMDEEYVIIDFNGELTREQLDEIEDEANEAIYKNLDFKTYFPDEKELKNLDYRSKLELTENVRIVEIDGVDVCACCAPHVKKSGEVGIIKLLDFMKHRGGVRIVMKAGSLALKDYREKYKNALGISNLLSVKQHEIFTATEKFYNDLADERRKFYEYRLSVANRDKENLKDINGSLVLIIDGYDADMMREVVNFGVEKTEKYSAVFSGDDESGYSFVIASKTQDMNALRNELGSKLNGRGGGRDGMIQGKAMTTKENIIDFFKEV